MKLMRMAPRSVVIAAIILFALFASLGSAAAKSTGDARHHTSGSMLKGTPPSGNGDTRVPPGFNDPNLPKATFMGLITAVDSPNGIDPNDFTLELGLTSEVIKLSRNTMITGKTAEAVVEGLASGDYAVVRAKRLRGTWYAIRVVFDVQALAPLRNVSGSIIRITKDLRHFVLKPDVGKGNILLRVVKQTRFHLDGRPIDGPPASLWNFGVANISAQILMRHDLNGWSAFDIYARSIS